MPDYKDNDPRGFGGDPKRGAALGRQNIDAPGGHTFRARMTLQRVPIDSGGYDPLGTYYGGGHNLYWLASKDGKVDVTFRATDDHRALEKAKELYPKAKLPKKVEGLHIAIGDVDIDAFTREYLQTALFAELDPSDESGGQQLDSNYTLDDFHLDFVLEAKQDCEDFQEANEELLSKAYEIVGYDETDAGSDFWLSRNGHGAGFFDRGLNELQEAAHVYGNVDVYVGDDGKLYGL